MLNWTVEDGAYGKLLLGRAVSEQCDIVFFILWIFHVVTFQLLCILIFSNFAYKICCDLFFTFGFL